MSRISHLSILATIWNVNEMKMKNVLKEVQKLSNFNKSLPKGHGIGVAIHYSFYSYVATAVEVSVINNRVKVENIYTVLDCGLYVNKDSVINQLEGSAIFGMSITLFGKITTREGAIEQSNFQLFTWICYLLQL